MNQDAVEVRGLRKAYGAHEAVRDVSLSVRRGEVFAFLGPNGAGKTTTVEILEGFRSRDGGEVRVLGADPASAGRAWRARLGIVLQEGGAQGELTVRETLELWAAYYPRSRPVDEVVELVGLGEAADRRVARLSGGQRRRLDVGLALVGEPELVFLDEPTTGFDPAARRAAWEVIARLRELGTTVFLTTHYMEEAQVLADRVAVIKAGRIVAEGRPDALGGGARLTEIAFRLPAGVAAGDLPVPARLRDGRAALRTEAPTRALAELCVWATARGLELEGLTVAPPSLEQVYLELVAEPAA